MKIRVKDTDRLNTLLIMKGFNKLDFSKQIGSSHPMTVQITNGDRNPSPRTAKRICEVLECEWSDIFEIVRDPKANQHSQVVTK
ncbi:helix-turn-helix domain-containing protein [Cohnella fermenti]|uniref:Helix-turn-helix transcriptional regulator n=1 Tax=Cohnella fermenti TaxID=2565925 RepID=A0A4S4CCM8_9BACL|nr:helix-turn-helix domain-containing protein [Cohnella fermenti]THF83712.1 helix-turn-helix transcriptional regulator [Cohnella fermenti]